MIGLRLNLSSPPPGTDVSEVWIEDHEFEAWVRSGYVAPDTMIWAGPLTGGAWRRAEEMEIYHLFRPEPPEPAPPPFSLAERLFPPRGLSALEMLLLANILMAALLVGLWRGDYPEELLSLMSRWREMVASGRQWHLLLPTIFIHADAGHLFRNLVALLAAAAAVEVFFGRTKTWLAYLVTGLTGAVVSYLGHGGPPLSVGASGAIFGLAGVTASFLVRYYPRFSERQRWKTRRIYAPLFVLLVLPSLVQADYLAHAGGFGGGVLLGAFMPLDPGGRELLKPDGEAGGQTESAPGAVTKPGA